MKKILLVLCILAYGNTYAQLFSQQILSSVYLKSSFSVELDGSVVIVPSSSIEKQIQFIAYRSVNDPYSGKFDELFFKQSLTVLQSYADLDIQLLKDWKDMFSSGKIIIKQDFSRFLKTTNQKYLISTSMLSSNNIMEVWQIGKVKLYVFKASIKERKNKIDVPEGCYYVTIEQSLN